MSAEQTLDKQGSATSKFSLTFYGTAHNPFDMAGVSHSLQLFEQRLPTRRGQAIFFEEAAFQREDTFKKVEQARNRYGGITLVVLRNIMAARLGRVPTIEEIKDQRDLIDSLGFADSIYRGLLQPHEACNYFKVVGLDKIARKYSFRLDGETHDETTIRKLQQTTAVGDRYQDMADQYFQIGDFNQMVWAQRGYYTAIFSANDLREADISRKLFREHGEKAFRSSKSTFVFIRTYAI